MASCACRGQRITVGVGSLPCRSDRLGSRHLELLSHLAGHYHVSKQLLFYNDFSLGFF